MQPCPTDLTNTEISASVGICNVPIIPLVREPITRAENIESINNFFSAFYGNAPGALGIWEKQNKQTRWIPAAQRDEAARACLEMVNRGLDVYFGVGLREKALTASTRGGTDTVVMIPGLWVDIDIAGPGHSSSELPPTTDDALQILNVLPFKHSVVVHSGGGLHAYWLFKEPWVFSNQEERSKAQRLSNQFQLLLRQEAKRLGWKLDNTADLARVLRVPCTKNFKVPGHPTDVVILKADYTLRYDPQQFEEFLETETETADVSRVTEFENGPGNAEDIVNNCRFIQHCRDDSQSLSEPDWHAMITVFNKVEGGEDLIHKFSDSYPGGSWAQTEQKIQEVKSSGLPCSCSYIKEQLGYDCTDNGCNVAGPISFANNASVVARLRINQLLPSILDSPAVCFEQDTLRSLAILKQTDQMEFGRFKARIKGKVNINDLGQAIKQQNAAETKVLASVVNDFFSSSSDNGNAERFVALYGKQIRYCNQNSKWYIWDGKRWIEDSTQRVKVLATRSLIQVCERAIAELYGNKLEDFLKWCEQSRSNSRIKSIVEMAQYGEGIPVKLEDFDKDPYLINCQNGTLNLKTLQLQPHQQSDLMSQIMPTNYDPDAQCPEWNNFLDHALNQDQSCINFLATVFGITLSGLLLKNFFFVYGPSNTGKSLCINLFQFMQAEYAAGISMDKLMTQKFSSGGGPNPELARLQRKRGVYASETTDGKHIDEALIKQYTGGDTVTIRGLYKDPVDFIPQFKLWIHGNHKPDIRGDDTGLWNRLILIPFTIVIPPEEQDHELLNKFKAELPGILAWAVRGCHEWIASGEKTLAIPERFKNEGEAYQSSMDTIGQFIDERCATGPKLKVVMSTLYLIYRAYCEENGSSPLKSAKFANKLQERGFEHGRSNRERFWKGISVDLMPTDIGNKFNMNCANQFSDKT